MSQKTIAVLATLDTKGKEAQFLREQIEKAGDKAVVIDTGVTGRPAARADITREQVAEAGGTPLGEASGKSRSRDRGPRDGRRGGENRLLAARSRRDSRRHRPGRHAGHDALHQGDAGLALRRPQDHGFDDGLGQRRRLGGHQGHHHDVLGGRYPGPQPADAEDPGQRGRRGLRRGPCRT